MNYLHEWLEFDTVEEGEKKLQDALRVRDQMSGAFYWNICNDDCKEIEKKLNDLKMKR